MAKRRTAAQRRATAKMIAANRARRRLGAAPRKRRRLRRNPISKAAAYRAVPSIAKANPIRRRRRRTAVASRRRVRRNPIRAAGLIPNLFMPAATAAAGALALDVAFGYLPIPANLKTPGPVSIITKSAGAILLTMIAGKVVSKSTAQAMGVGALTVILHDAAKAFIMKSMPTLKLDGLGYYSAGYPVGGYMDGLGVYVGAGGSAGSGLPNMNGLGEYVHGVGRVDNEQAYYGAGGF